MARARLPIARDGATGPAIVTQGFGREAEYRECVAVVRTRLNGTAYTASGKRVRVTLHEGRTQWVAYGTPAETRRAVRQAVKDQTEQISTAILLARERQEAKLQELRRDEYRRYLQMVREREEREQVRDR